MLSIQILCDLAIKTTVVYISGYVSRKLLRIIKCEECRVAVVEPAKTSHLPAYQLIQLKNNGGLVLPSKRIHKILLFTDHYLRELTYNQHNMELNIPTVNHASDGNGWS